MHSTCSDAPAEAVTLSARATIAAALAAALDDPLRVAACTPVSPDKVLLADAWEEVVGMFAACAPIELGVGERAPRPDDGAGLSRWLAMSADLRGRAYVHVFGLVVSRLCPPFETEYCATKDTFFRAQQMADIAGFYRAFSCATVAGASLRPDHASPELSFIALLLSKLARIAWECGGEEKQEEVRVCFQALRAFIRDHASWWMPAFANAVLHRVDTLAGAIRNADERNAVLALGGAASCLRSWMALERHLAGVEPARRITQASVEADVDPSADECGACGTCADGAGPHSAG